MNRMIWALPAALFLLGITLSTAAMRAMPQRVLLERHQLRMLVQGSGSPSVVLETFGPAPLETWRRIQPEIARTAKVVAYDHAGYWGSEPGPKPRDARQIAMELRAALKAAGVPPPYLLVGYSFGGPYIRVFASLYPSEVAGLVFVDPSQEEFMDWLSRHFPELNVVTEAERLAQDEWGVQQDSMQQAREARLPEVPITLLSAAQAPGPLFRRLIPEWLAAHRRWLDRHPNSRHQITTNSGHGIWFTEPELISQAVRSLIHQHRSNHSEAFSDNPQRGSEARPSQP